MTSSATPVRSQDPAPAPVGVWEQRALVTAVVTAGALVRLIVGTSEPTIAPDPYDDQR